MAPEYGVYWALSLQKVDYRPGPISPLSFLTVSEQLSTLYPVAGVLPRTSQHCTSVGGKTRQINATRGSWFYVEDKLGAFSCMERRK